MIFPPTNYASLSEDEQNNYWAKGTKKYRDEKAAEALQKITQKEQDNRSPEYSDDGLATMFSDKHAVHLRYVAKWGKWLSWDGKKWSLDDTLKIYDHARIVCRDAAKACSDARSKKTIASAKTISSVEVLSRSDRRIAATVEQWDSDPFLLNTPGGIVDLKTGEMRPATPEDYCRKITSVMPNKMDEALKFADFLHDIFGGDRELIAFIRRVLGYGLTGSTKEHALFFGFGTGRNGKSVLLKTVADILGDYHCTAPIETFTATKIDRHPTELADLQGARLVTSCETEEGRAWAESRIKLLTGGDTIKARYMRQDLFQFTPEFKLFVVGNNKPKLRQVDQAMRRRMNLIPFDTTIPIEKVDKELVDKLRREGGSILSWLITGALEWQEIGLSPPEAVCTATESYLNDEDTFGAWLDECCELDMKAHETKADLFASWAGYAEQQHEHSGSMKSFVNILEKRPFRLVDKKLHGHRGYYGLRLLNSSFSRS